MASSRSRAARTCSCISARSPVTATAAWTKGRRSSSTSPRARRDPRQKTSGSPADAPPGTMPAPTEITAATAVTQRRAADRVSPGELPGHRLCGEISSGLAIAPVPGVCRPGMIWRINMTGSAWARRAWPEMIRAGTQLRTVPLVPDIRLHLASDPISLWQRTELRSGQDGLDPPFWAFAWAGGLALARYLLDHPETVRGRHAIDVASGSGVVAIAAAMAGAAAVTAYDIDPVAAVAIGMNAAANGAMVLAVCADVLDQDNLPASGTGLVLVADAFYERDLAGKVTKLAER